MTLHIMGVIGGLVGILSLVIVLIERRRMTGALLTHEFLGSAEMRNVASRAARELGFSEEKQGRFLQAFDVISKDHWLTTIQVLNWLAVFIDEFERVDKNIGAR